MPVVINLSDIEKCLDSYCTEYGVKDMSKTAQMKWTGALLYIYDHVFKPNDNTVRYNKASILDYKDIKQLRAI